jgi:hypothetical protein
LSSRTPNALALLTFRGGLELLFAHKRNFAFSLPKRFGQPSQNATINFLIKQLSEREMKDPRRDLFIKDDTVYHSQVSHYFFCVVVFRGSE